MKKQDQETIGQFSQETGESSDRQIVLTEEIKAEIVEETRKLSKLTNEGDKWDMELTKAWEVAVQIAQMKDNELKIVMEENNSKIYVRDGLIRQIGKNGERIVLTVATSEEVARKVHKWMKHFSDEWMLSFMK